jgi:predicted outer membrane repeat protein
MRIHRPLAAVAAVALAAVVWPAPSHAATLTVGPGGGNGACASPTYADIQAAVDAATDNDVILICPGSYSLTETITSFNKDLTFIGGGADATILTRSTSGRIMSLAGDGVITVEGLTFTGGEVGDGGAALVSAGPLTIVDSVFSSNTSTGNNGGAVFANSDLSISGSTFSGNSAPGTDRDGGAVYASDPFSTVVIEDSTFYGNTADRLGGAVITEGPVTISGSTFTSNEVSPMEGIGGAVWSGSPTVTTSTFSYNVAASGGAVASTDGGVVVSRSTFDGNFAGDLGGAIRTGEAPVQVWNSTFLGNNARNAGGAIFTEGTVSVASVTFAANFTTFTDRTSIAAGSGGSVANTVFGDDSGDGCGISVLTDNGGNVTTDDTCPGAVVPLAELDLSPLADNGGPTQTMALGKGSVAIDVGVDDYCTGAPDEGIDQRGFPRVVGDSCDAGAYEAGAAPDVSQLPPPWLKAVGRGSAEVTCPSGSAPSWAFWPNDGRGGYTCESSLVYNPNTGRWQEQAGFPG